MPVNILSRPAVVNFTDQQNVYLLSSTISSYLKKIQVEIYTSVNSSVPVANLIYPPGNFFTATLQINELIAPFTSFSRPRIDGDYYAQIQEAVGHKVEAWISTRLFDASLTTQEPFVPDDAHKIIYIKGGYGLWSKQPNFNFENRRKWMFSWQPSPKLIAADDPNWILYTHPVAEKVNLEYLVYYTDGSSQSVRSGIEQINDNVPESQWKQLFIPIGPTQCGLTGLQTGKMIYRYLVRVLNFDTDEIFGEYEYRVDYRPNYDAFTVYYRNSLGGWDSLRMLGAWQEDFAYARSDFRQSVYDSAGNFLSNSVGAQQWYINKETRQWKANTGHISKSDINAVRDMLISKELAVKLGASWVPLRITSDSITGLNTAETLQNMPLEFETAFDNEHYTPDKLPWEA